MKDSINKYWTGIDDKLKILLKDGAVKLPSLSIFDLDTLSDNISNELGPLTFKEGGLSHREFLDYLQIDKFLSPKLFNLAKEFFGFRGKLSNQYHIARKVLPGNIKEQFRAHFDSHIFTMVLPIKIPISSSGQSTGDLIYFSNIRDMPNNEISNLFGKVYYKKFASSNGIKKLIKNKNSVTENFINYQPLIFLGKTTLHANYPVAEDCSSYRLTLLAHFFDDSSKFSSGNILRFLRNR